jgi:hypothetical protein
LSHALTHEQRHDMLSAFVSQKVDKFGIAADVAIHYGRAGNMAMREEVAKLMACSDTLNIPVARPGFDISSSKRVA